MGTVQGRRSKMKECARDRVGVLLTAALCLVLGSSAVAQPEEEGDKGPRLREELSAKLSELDRWAEKLAKVEEGESVASGSEEIATILDWLGSRVPEIERYFESKGDSDKVREARELGTAVKDARSAVEKWREDEGTTAGLIIIVCREVVRVGGEVVAALGGGE
jgi:hypothetical protein